MTPRAPQPSWPEKVPGKVSVIITCHDGDPWIARAVRSALGQTYRNREIIVVDDASADGSTKRLKEFIGAPGFTLIRHETNRGIPQTKNSGIRRATGEYVAFLDQDDEWLPRKLERQVALLEAHPEVGLVHVSPIFLDAGGREYLRRGSRDGQLAAGRKALEAVFRKNPVHSKSSVLLRRRCLEALGCFDERFHGADDWNLWMRTAERYAIAHLAEPLFRYRVHPCGFSWAAADRMQDSLVDAVEEAVASRPFLEPLRNRRLAHAWLSVGVLAFERGESRRKALDHALHALALDPSLLRTYPALALMAAGSAGRLLLRLFRQTVQYNYRIPARATLEPDEDRR